MKIPKYVKDIYSTLASNGHTAYVVGGSIRNFLLNLPIKDYDIATSATPEEVEKLFDITIPTGVQYGTTTVVCRKKNKSYFCEVTTYRTEFGYSDRRHPDKIEFSSNILEDLARRDFTMNAIAYDIGTQSYIDPYNGIKDIEDRLIRCVNKPSTRFEEDSLRMFRACRFAGQLGFKIENNTRDALIQLGYILPLPSMERVLNELNLTFSSKHKLKGFGYLLESKLFKKLLLEEYDYKYLESLELKDKDSLIIWARILYNVVDLRKMLYRLKFTNKDSRLVINLINRNFNMRKAKLTVKDLKLKGIDIQNFGFKDKEIGDIQKNLFNLVLTNKIRNSYRNLLQYFLKKYCLPILQK